MEVKNLSFAYNKESVLNDISFTLAEGKITTIMGANGSGKTTLLNLMSKNLRPQNGEIRLNGREIQKINLKDFAKEVAMVHQSNTAPPDLEVKKLVAYGRLPYAKTFRNNSEEDENKINNALEITGLMDLKDKEISTLSGGQRQRVWIAMALAQDPKILFLDEPTTFLDIRYQIQILDMIKQLNQEYSMTILMILHDINQAMCYSDEILGLADGKMIIRGNPKQVIDEDIIQKLYGVKLEMASIKGKKVVLTASY